MLNDNTPIPLTLFEKYFLLDASKDFPMQCDGVLHVDGALHREQFGQAVQKCLQVHPLFTRKIEKRNGRYYWVAVEPENRNAPVKFLESPIDINSRQWNEPVDLFLHNGLELSVFTDAHETKIYYRIPHICTDASGFFRFLNDVFSVYSDGETVSDADNSERIFERDNFPPADLPAPVSQFQVLRSTVKEIIKWLMEKPSYLGRKRSTSAVKQKDTAGRFFRKTYCISSEKLSRIQQFTQQSDCNLNDVLLTAFFHTVPEHCSSSGNCCRIMVPLNMRWKGSETIPAANIISYVFLSRTKSQRGDGLLQFIHGAMRYIKDWNIGVMFLDGVKFFSRIPFGMRLMTRRKKCLATLVFSNIGSIEKFFGGCTLTPKYIENFAPSRYLTNLSAVGSIQNGQLFFNCLINTEFFTEDDLDKLFRDYESALERIFNAAA